MTTDPIADMLIRIKNAYMARLPEVSLPHSKIKESLANLLVHQGFLKQAAVETKIHKILVLKLHYINGQPRLTHIHRESRPGRRLYVKKHKTPRVLGGLGISILSTPQGLMTNNEAYKKGIGGEVLCTLW